MRKRGWVCLAVLGLMTGIVMAGDVAIDHEGLAPGTVVDVITDGAGASGGLKGSILVYGFNPAFGLSINAAVIFPSDAPTGGDFDLGTPNQGFGGPGLGAGGRPGGPNENAVALYNTLIVAENLDDGNNDGLVDDPDDADELGQYMEYDFSGVRGGGKVTVNSVTYMDVEVEEGEEGAFIELIGDFGTQLITMDPTGNNGVNTIEGIGIEDVEKMRVTLNGSGAIETVLIEAPLERFCWCTTGGFQNAGFTSGGKDFTFGGNVGPPASGSWEVNDHNTGDMYHSNDVRVVECSDTGSTGPQQPGGKKGFEIDRLDFVCDSGKLNGASGYPCTGFVIDGGEPADKKGNDPDYFEITVTDPNNGNAVVFHAAGDLDGGNVQLHPPVGKP